MLKFYEIVRGIIYLHTFDPPICHRDLKPENILLDRNKGIKIADLGLARMTKSHTGGGGKTGKIRGSLPYMAPESFNIDLHLGPHIDI